MALILLLGLARLIMVSGQLCAPETGVLQLINTGQCGHEALKECWRQSVLQTAGNCQTLWQPGTPMGMDGVCAPNPGLLSRMTGTMSGPFRMGSKPLSYAIMAGGPNTLLVRMSGTYAPHGGGQEFLMNGCVLQFQVVKGTVGGIGPGHDNTDMGEGTPAKTADLGFNGQVQINGASSRKRARNGSSSSAGCDPSPRLALTLLLALVAAAWLSTS